MTVLSELNGLGAFASRAVHKREINVSRPIPLPESEWGDPAVPEYTGEFAEGTITVYLQSSMAADDIAISNAPPEVRPFVAVFRYVVEKDGKPVFESLEQAMSLKTWLVVPLFGVISEFISPRPKHSRRGMSSGAKSPSPSAAGRSKSGKKRSAQKSLPHGGSTEINGAPLTQ